MTDDFIFINGDLEEPEAIIVEDGCCNIVDGYSEYDEKLVKSQHLSEFNTAVDKAKARKNLGIPDEYNLQWGNIGGFIESQNDLWSALKNINISIDKLENKVNNSLQEGLNEIKQELKTKITKETEGDTATEQIAYTNPQYPNMTNMQQALDELLYIPLSINFSCSPSIAEKGEVITSWKFTWSYNKNTIVSQSLTEASDLKLSDRTYTFNNQSITENTSKTLSVNDGVKAYSSSRGITFYPGIYYGVSTKDSIETQDIIAFTRKLQGSRNMTITINASNPNDSIYICIPESYGVPIFKVGGFEGGFTLLNGKFSFSRYDNTTVVYRIYKSDNKGLGNTTINIL